MRRNWARSAARLSLPLLMLMICVPAIGRAQAAELLMLEQPGCVWCQNWHKQIGPIYPKTTEGQRAPLRRINIREGWPADLAGIRSDVFTPTFVLIENGAEIDRIRGYPGEDFFWGLLGAMIDKLPAVEQPGPAPANRNQHWNGAAPYGPVSDSAVWGGTLALDVQASSSDQ